MTAWAECGNSRNRDRVKLMREANADDPRIAGLFAQLFSAYGVGSKGGGGSLTRQGEEVLGKLTLYSYQGPDDDGHDNLQSIEFDMKEAQRRQTDKDNSPWNRDYTYAALGSNPCGQVRGSDPRRRAAPCL